MPGEVIQAGRRQQGQQGGPGHRITVQGRTVRIHLAGILDRPGVQRLMRQVATTLSERDLVVVLDASQLRHLDYRCVGMLLRWRRTLSGWGHRLVLAGWNGYLQAILAMEDWDGELEEAFRTAASGRATEPWRHVQAP